MTDTTTAANDAPNYAITINAQYVKDLSFENPNFLAAMQPKQQAPEVQINLGVRANSVGKDSYEVILDVRAQAASGDTTDFLIELAYAGIFTLTGIPQEHLEPVLFIEGPRLLFPFARAIVAETTRDGGFPPLMLNPIDFVDLYRRRQAELAQNADSTTATVN
jgi:preprotein translocase subunit SecB